MSELEQFVQIKNRSWSNLEELAETYIEQSLHGEPREDLAQYVLEEVLEQIYGKKVFETIRKINNGNGQAY